MAIALGLLLCAGSATFYFWDYVSALWLPFLVVFFRRAIWRLAYRFCFFLVIVPFMPDRFRHEYFKLIAALKHATVVYGEDAAAIWKWAPWWLRVPMALGGAVLSGLGAFALLILPVHVGKVPFVGGWLRETGVPYLMRSATAHGIELNLPAAWKGTPEHIRQRLKKPYMRLWWWTARRLVRSRQAIGRRTLRRLKKKARNK